MIGHEQSCDDLALHDVSFHDLRHIGFCADPIPHTFGIDHDAGSEFAMVKATSLIRADHPFEIQSLGFALKMGVQFFRAEFGTAPSWIVVGALVCTDEDMSLKRWHDIRGYAGMVMVVNRSRRSVTSC